MKRLLYILTILFAIEPAFTQQENTLYMMDRVPYASTLNPAMTPDCKWYLGGAALPITGQLPPSLYISATTPFAYDDILYKGTGRYSDSLITPLFSPEDFAQFKKKLNKQNLFSLEADIPTLMFGFRAKQTFWTFSMTEKVRANAIFPKNVFLLPIEGNGAVQEADLSGIAFNAMAYREYALGFTQQVDKYFKAGVRLKYLSGYYNLYTEQSEFKIITDTEKAELITETNMIINTSAPIDSVTLDENGNVEEIHTRTPSQEEITKTATFSNNWGVALDFGLTKDFNSEITLYLSAVDIGYMNWVNDPHAFVFEGKQTFSGLAIDSLNFAESINDYSIDSLLNDYKYTSKKSEYSQWLPMKFYLGADYKVRDWLKLGLLYRGEYFFNHLYNAYTLSLNFRYMKFSSTSLSYTIKNKNYVNVGLGTSFRMGPFNTFFVSDNIGAAIWWYKSELFAFRMGTSYVFGVNTKRKARKNVPLLDLYR